MYLVFFGLGFRAITSSSALGNTAYLTFLTPGIMAFQVVMAGAVGGGILWSDRRWGMLSQLLVGPFTRLQYLLGIMITAMLFGLGGAAVMLGVAYLMIGAIAVPLWSFGVIFGAIVVGSIFFGSLMLFISGLVKSNNAYNSIQILLIFILNFASTVFYPLSPRLPLALGLLFRANPLTYVADVVRGAYLHQLNGSDALQLFVLLVEMVVFVVLATRTYMRSDISFV